MLDGGKVLKLTVRGYLLYSIPFIISVLLAFQWDILSVLGSFYGWLLVSIFTFGLPIIIFCLPYAIYYYILQRYLKVPLKVSIKALIVTIAGFIIVAVGVENFYKPMEKRMYFSQETTNRLEERSLALFEKETGVKGEVIKLETMSRKADWNEGNMTSVQQRMYDIEIAKTKSSQDETHHYIFILKNGKWVLKRAT